MNTSAFRFDAAGAISSLDLVYVVDPPSRWRPTCERLQSELHKGRIWRTRIEAIGYTLLIALLIISEWETLSPSQWALLGTGAGALLVSAFLQGNAARGARAVAAATWIFVVLILHGVHNPLASALNIIPVFAVFSSEALFPALRHEERIDALLAYFGLQPASATEPAHAAD